MGRCQLDNKDAENFPHATVSLVLKKVMDSFKTEIM